MNKFRIDKVVVSIVIAIIFLSSGLILLNRIQDPDFFWHLKTGELLWKNRTLPSEDPFAYTSKGFISNREHIILTSYWISQVIYYFFYRWCGFGGIVIMRFVILGLMIHIMWRRKEGDVLLYGGLLLVCLLTVLSLFPVERPHFFSFLFFGVLLHLLDRIRKEGLCTPRLVYFSVPLLMLIWANMHGGFILGQIAIVLYVAVEGIKFAYGPFNALSKKTYGKLAATGLAALIISLANPNSYHVMYEMATASEQLTAGITEFLSSYQYYLMFNDKGILLSWLVMGITFTGMLFNWRKLDVTEVVLLAGTAFFSLLHVRYIPFFLVAALPVANRYLSVVRFRRVTRVSMVAVVFIALCVTHFEKDGSFRRLMSREWLDTELFPVAAADFVLDNGLSGNMYNYYDWGGYLIWRLSPSRKVFIDGRIIAEAVYQLSENIDRAVETKDFPGLPLWKSALNAYHVNYIVIPYAFSDGEMLPLFRSLMNDDEWVLVFIKDTSLIFIRNLEENSRIIRKYAVSGKSIPARVIAECDKMIREEPENVFAHLVKAELAYWVLKDFVEAKKAYLQALDIEPLNLLASRRLRELRYIEGTGAR